MSARDHRVTPGTELACGRLCVEPEGDGQTLAAVRCLSAIVRVSWPSSTGGSTTWAGLGLVVAGMTHQGWDVQLTAYAARDWRANFFPVGIAHSVVGSSAQEPTPWRAVQRAAWETLTKASVR
jgi:hypothetical protein